MKSQKVRVYLASCLLSGLLGLGMMPAGAMATEPCTSCFSCQKHHCPPALKHCMERPPCIHWHHGCPKPICNPCDLPHWGYYQTCWTPWPWPNDYSHCPVPPPAAFVRTNPGGIIEPGGEYYRPYQPGQPGQPNQLNRPRGNELLPAPGTPNMSRLP